MSARKGRDDVVRFSLRQRLEHLAIMLLFLVLSLTGFPQKFPDSALSQALSDAAGGVQALRSLHRGAGLMLLALSVAHFATLIAGLAARRLPLSMLPTRKDFEDAVTTLRYYLRLAASPARFDRYDYREKFEYWGLVIGNLVMVCTGLVLMFPIFATRYLPGELVPVAKVAHSNEGLLAFLVVITWHVFNAHLAPDIFPFNKTIFTGRISKRQLRRDHPLEYERLFPDEAAAEAQPSDVTPPVRDG
jgi:cytochrome b subunit of formate dehydrogenase